MKVLHFIPGYNFGGIETIFKKMLIYKSKNIEFILIVEDRTPQNKIKEIEELGCKVYVIPHLSYRNIFTYYNKMGKIFKEIKEIDIVHSYDVTRSFIFFDVAKKHKVENRILHARANEVDGSYLKQKTSNALLRLAVKNTTYKLANSTKSGEYFYGKNSYRIINNGIDTEEYKYDTSIRKVIKKKLNIKDEDIVVGHVGRFTHQKNYPFLLQIFYEFQLRVPNSKLLLVGDGPQYDSIVQQIEKFKITDKVLLVGEQTKINDFYQAMDIFLFPSFYESFGNVAVEAQSSGLKVIASSEIPKEVNITGLVTYVPLSEGVEEWVDTIINNLGYERKIDNEILQNSGYDIKDHVKEIIKIYNYLIQY